MNPRFRVHRGSWLAGLVCLLLGLSAARSSPPQEPQEPPQEPQGEVKPGPPPRSEVQQALSEIRKQLLLGGRSEAEQVVGRVRELGARLLDERERESWVRVARDVALRLGDRAWLEQLRTVPDGFAGEINYALMFARSQLEHANLTGAKATLAELGDIEELNPREARRAYSLRARTAQLGGDVVGERANVELLIGHLDKWPRQRCQTCHAQTKAPTVITSLAIDRLWAGERYVALMREQGDAAEVRTVAERQLAEHANDDSARIRLAFALRALGDEAGAMARFRELSWASLPDRPGQKPMQMAAYP